jgi:hypothetical protein
MSPQKPVEEVLETKFFLDIDHKGTFNNNNPLHIPGYGEIKVSPADVDAMFAGLETDTRQHLVLFFHGGLVGEGSGMKAAKRFTRFYKEAIHPYSFVWETGIVTSLAAYVQHNMAKEIFKKLFNHVTASIFERFDILPGGPDYKAFVSADSDDAAAMLQTPGIKAKILEASHAIYAEGDLEQIRKDIESTKAIAAADDIYTFPETMAMSGQEEMMTASIDGGIPIPGKVAFKAAIIAARCILRFARKRHHGVGTTIEEEILRQISISIFNIGKTAEGVWSEMKDQAAGMWNSNKNREGDNQYAGRYFLDKLAAYKQDRPLRVDLVGHSAGSIAICELIKVIEAEPEKYGHIRFNKIVFLAPACKCDLFHATIMRYQNRYEQFRMFGMKQAVEEKDNMIPPKIFHFVYAKSLLYFVSGLCEDGDRGFDEDIKGDTCILGLDQHTSGNAPYTRHAILNEIHTFLHEGTPNSRRIVLTPNLGEDTINGYRGQAIHHGDFDNDGDFENTPGDLLENSIRESLGYIFSS